MPEIFTMDVVFKIWCVLTNSILYYAQIDFLLNFWGSQNRRLAPLYVAASALLTIAALWTRMFPFFNVIHIVFMLLFSVKCFNISPKYVITPAAVIFTLSTFAEGFVTVFMQYLSSTLTNRTLGAFYQFALPTVSAMLFFAALRMIVKRYPLMNPNFGSSYLHILLLPSALIIGGIRTSLGLDASTGKFSHGALIAGHLSSALYAALWMTGTLLVFFIIIEVYHKLSVLSLHEMERSLLASEIKEQYHYIDEARQRNESYRSFQHDINNHLLVLSGFLRSQEYQQAENYLQKINTAASGLSGEISTGNSVLDILLWEKIRYAKQNNIAVTCDVQIPKESSIDDIDLCILFANGLDNAIQACMDTLIEHKTITLTAKPKHTFLLIDMVNSVNHPTPLVYGTGLKNIELTAKKYAGSLHTEQTDTQFSLSILLCYKRFSQKQ